jgi:hypothetical protein
MEADRLKTTKRVRTIREKLWTTKRDAAKRNIAWQIKDADALRLFEMPCHYCEAESEPGKFSGIDRKNNERYYRKSNSVPCCWVCNRAKCTMTHEQWLGLCQRIGVVFMDRVYIDFLGSDDAADEARKEEYVREQASALGKGGSHDHRALSDSEDVDW